MLTGNKNVDIIILNKLDDKDLVEACQVNKRADVICNDQTFWMDRIVTKFPEVPNDILRKYKGGRTWSEYYINDLRKINKSTKYYLIEGSRIGRLDYVIIALEKGADIHHKDDWALRNASYNGRLDVIKYLISKRANINVNNDEPLRDAASKGYLDIVKYLVSQGANIHANNDHSLVWASTLGYLEIVKYLVSQGADINAQDNQALKGATERDHLDVVKYLKSISI